MQTTDVMENLRVDALKALAKKADIAKGVTRKGDLIAAFSRLLRDNLPGYLELLSPTERSFLAEAAYNRGRVEPLCFAAKYKADCPEAGARYSRRSTSLIQLVVDEDEYSNAVRVPDELISPLQQLLPEPAKVTIDSVEEIPTHVEIPGLSYEDHREVRPLHQFCGEANAWSELRRVLSLAQAGKIRVQDKSRRPTAAGERAIGNSLMAPDFDLELPSQKRDAYSLDGGAVRAHAWAVLVQQCGWCRPRKGVLALTAEGKKLVGGVSKEEFRKGVDRLCTDDNFDELNRINHIRGQSGKGKRYLTRPSERREAIMMSMAGWPVNRWVGFDDAHRFVYASGHELWVTDDPYQLYFCERQYGYLGDAAGVNRQYNRVFLLETLATLGLIDVAYVYPHYLWPDLRGSWGTDDMDFCGRYDGLLCVRLNPLGAWCLGVTDSYEPPVPEKRNLFSVLPNRELALAGDVQPSTADVGMLELFCKQRSDRVWRLDPQRLLTFVENGGAIGEAERFLEQNSAVPIPETVRVFLADLASKADVVVGRQDALLVELKDAHTAALIANDPKTRKYCYLAGERHLAVIKKNEKAFRTALKKLGYVLPP